MDIAKQWRRAKDWWHRTPRAFTGTVLANRLGWQIVRVLWFNFWRRLGYVPVTEKSRRWAVALERDGAVVIPDFLPESIYREIRAEFEKEARDVPFKGLASKYIMPKDGMTRVGVAHFFPKEGTRLYELLDTHLIKNEMLRELGSVMSHTRIDTFRPPQVFVNQKLGDQYPDLNSDIFYHADVSYPGVKAFYYLSDTNEENGAFRYVLGSHKLTWKRLKWEYRKSIEHAMNRRRVGNPFIQGDELGRSWHCLTRDEEKREGMVGTSMNGKANSLLVFNVMGFHRRGDFSSDKKREFALAYFRE